MTSLFSRNSPKRKGAGAFSSRTEDPERTGWAKVYQKCRRPDTRHFFNTCNPVGSAFSRNLAACPPSYLFSTSDPKAFAVAVRSAMVVLPWDTWFPSGIKGESKRSVSRRTVASMCISGSRSPVLCIPDQGCSIAHHETQGTEVLPELSALADEVGRPRGACE